MLDDSALHGLPVLVLKERENSLTLPPSSPALPTLILLNFGRIGTEAWLPDFFPSLQSHHYPLHYGVWWKVGLCPPPYCCGFLFLIICSTFPRSCRATFWACLARAMAWAAVPTRLMCLQCRLVGAGPKFLSATLLLDRLVRMQHSDLLQQC